MRAEFRLDSNLAFLVVLVFSLTLAFVWTVRRSNARFADDYRIAIEDGHARSVAWTTRCGGGARKVLMFEGSHWCIDRAALDRIAAER